MVVQHNLRAMNSNRMLGLTVKSQSKSTEKLSSGYKINRAADDAAGLSISEKMRKQIRGLTQASLNAQDGISSVQTAEGALNEVQDMLQRMNELAVKASNGTMSESDRNYVQNEIDQLVTELDRVAETTKFNETYLLKGTDATATKTLSAHDAGFAGKLTDNGNGTSTFALDKALEDGNKISIAGKEYTIGTGAGTNSTKGYSVYDDVKDIEIKAGDTITSNAGDTYTFVDKIAVANNWANGTKFTITDEQGNATEYTIAAATDLAAGNIKNTDAKALIDKELLNPTHKVTMTNYNTGAANVAVNAEIVSALDTTERSMVTWVGKTVDDFNTTNAAGGGLDNGGVQEVVLGGEKTTITDFAPVSSADIAAIVNAMRAGDQLKLNAKTITIADKTDLQNDEYSVEDALKAINNDEGDMDQIEFNIQAANKEGTKILAEKGLTSNPALDGTNAVTVVGATTGTNGSNVISAAEAYSKMAEELQKASSIGADEAAQVVNNNDGTFRITQGTVEIKEALTLNLHVGADADTTNKISFSVDTMSAAGLGVKGLNVTDGTGTAATYAVDAIAAAIQQVSTQRSALGAVQNRLEHTINNLDNVVENTTSAESQIRDTDMATEMVKYSNNNILAQAGQSMLAQSNQANQGILALLN